MLFNFSIRHSLDSLLQRQQTAVAAALNVKSSGLLLPGMIEPPPPPVQLSTTTLVGSQKRKKSKVNRSSKVKKPRRSEEEVTSTEEQGSNGKKTVSLNSYSRRPGYELTLSALSNFGHCNHVDVLPVSAFDSVVEQQWGERLLPDAGRLQRLLPIESRKIYEKGAIGAAAAGSRPIPD